VITRPLGCLAGTHVHIDFSPTSVLFEGPAKTSRFTPEVHLNRSGKVTCIGSLNQPAAATNRVDIYSPAALEPNREFDAFIRYGLFLATGNSTVRAALFPPRVTLTGVASLRALGVTPETVRERILEAGASRCNAAV